MPVLDIVMRILHVGSAIALLGGSLFVLVAMLPASRQLGEEAGGSLLKAAGKRFHRVAHPAVALLLITGFYNFFRNLDVYGANPPLFHGLIGVKIILALIVFAIVFAHSAGALKGSPGKWVAINVTLGTIIVILASTVRHLRLDELAGQAAAGG